MYVLAASTCQSASTDLPIAIALPSARRSGALLLHNTAPASLLPAPAKQLPSALAFLQASLLRIEEERDAKHEELERERLKFEEVMNALRQEAAGEVEQVWARV
eukprot:365445-Chlamydomonas_euryale.AAC.6